METFDDNQIKSLHVPVSRYIFGSHPFVLKEQLSFYVVRHCAPPSPFATCAFVSVWLSLLLTMSDIHPCGSMLSAVKGCHRKVSCCAPSPLPPQRSILPVSAAQEHNSTHAY